MKFASMRLLVNDFAASVRFWHDLLGLNMTYSDESIGYAYFETGGTTGIELYQRDGFASALLQDPRTDRRDSLVAQQQQLPTSSLNWQKEYNKEKPNTSSTFVLGELTPTAALMGRQTVLTFGVDDVDNTYADLIKRGAVEVSGPHDRPEWRARTAHISDPDGNLVELYSPLQASEIPTA